MSNNMQSQAVYNWEAERPDGSIMTEGGDLAGCVRFSLIPLPGTELPRHDVIGVEMIRRFGRGFIRAMGGGMKEYLHCLVCKGFRMYVRSSNGTILITPEDYDLYL
jgi:hypothetical protein